MSSDNSRERRTTSEVTVRTWLRSPFGSRGQRSRPTRPYVDRGREVARYQSPPLL